MAYVLGVVVALLVSAFARIAGFDRDRSFYPTVLIITATYYVLFAAIGQSNEALIVETIVMVLFVAVAVAGFRLKPWMIAAGFAAHAVFDLVHGGMIDNPGVPPWWPAFCLAIDVALAGLLLLLPSRYVHASNA